MHTKKQIIEKAFRMLGMGSAFNIGPAEMQDALDDLDTMMAAWAGVGLDLGYALPTNPSESSTADNSGLPDDANEPVILNLAMKLAPGYGKTPMPGMGAQARSGYLALLRRAVRPPQQQMQGNVPLGAGNRPWRAHTQFTPLPESVFDADGNPIAT